MSSLLYAAEVMLGIGAAFGFLAVLAMLFFSWQLVLLTTSIAIVALILAMILLLLPSRARSRGDLD